jgi:hypothetical protein
MCLGPAFTNKSSVRENNNFRFFYPDAAYPS